MTHDEMIAVIRAHWNGKKLQRCYRTAMLDSVRDDRWNDVESDSHGVHGFEAVVGESG